MAFSVGYCGCSAKLVPTPENPMACAAGVRCINHVCGNGDWRATVKTLLEMPYIQRRHAWPDLTNEQLDSMIEYAETLNLQDKVTEAEVQKEIKDTAIAMAKARAEVVKYKCKENATGCEWSTVDAALVVEEYGKQIVSIVKKECTVTPIAPV